MAGHPGARRGSRRSNRELALANCTASSKAVEFAISVVEVTMPRVCASTMARFTPDGESEIVGIDDQATHAESLAAK